MMEYSLNYSNLEILGEMLDIDFEVDNLDLENNDKEIHLTKLDGLELTRELDFYLKDRLDLLAVYFPSSLLNLINPFLKDIEEEIKEYNDNIDDWNALIRDSRKNNVHDSNHTEFLVKIRDSDIKWLDRKMDMFIHYDNLRKIALESNKDYLLT